MIKQDLSVAKGRLSHLVNSALVGKHVVICKRGVPVVRLIPVRPPSGEDPCRVIAELVVSVGDEALMPLDRDDWGELAQ